MIEKELLYILNQYYPINFKNLELLREGGCVSYKAYSEEKIYFLKKIPQAFYHTAYNSIDILLFLEDKDILTPHILLTKAAKPYVEMQIDGNKNMLVLFEYLEGSEPDTIEDYEEIGVIVGKLHSIMKTYKGSLSTPQKEYYIERYLEILKQKNYPKEKISEYARYGDELWDKVKDLPRGFCHGDMHKGNLLKTPSGQIYVLDFDTASWSFPMYDIMIMCNGTDYFEYHEDNYKKTFHMLRQFLKGYELFRKLETKELEVFTDLIAIYHYQLQATIVQIYGLNCIDEDFMDDQMDWLLHWKKQSEWNKGKNDGL